MSQFQKLSHVIWRCQYHIVWVPKYRYRVLSGEVKNTLEWEIRSINEWLGCEVKELNVREDHIHIVAVIPPKISISDYMGTLKGKTAIKLFKNFPGLRQKPYWGNHLWSRGYCVSTVGINEEMIRKYVRYQEKEDKREEREQGKFNFF